MITPEQAQDFARDLEQVAMHSAEAARAAAALGKTLEDSAHRLREIWGLPPLPGALK